MTDEHNSDENVRELDVPVYSPIASDLATAVGKAIEEQGTESFIQALRVSTEDGAEVEIQIRDHLSIIDAARETLVEHRDEFEDCDEFTLESVDIDLDGASTIRVVEHPEPAPES